MESLIISIIGHPINLTNVPINFILPIKLIIPINGEPSTSNTWESNFDRSYSNQSSQSNQCDQWTPNSSHSWVPNYSSNDPYQSWEPNSNYQGMSNHFNKGHQFSYECNQWVPKNYSSNSWESNQFQQLHPTPYTPHDQ